MSITQHGLLESTTANTRRANTPSLSSIAVPGLSPGLQRYYRRLFLFAGAWNIVLTVSALVIASVDKDAFLLIGMTDSGSLLPYYALLPQLTLFGVGYALVGLNLARNHAFLVLGAIGKTVFFLAILYYYLRHKVNLIPMALLIGDMIQVGLFVEFLVRVRGLSRLRS